MTQGTLICLPSIRLALSCPSSALCLVTLTLARLRVIDTLVGGSLGANRISGSAGPLTPIVWILLVEVVEFPSFSGRNEDPGHCTEITGNRQYRNGMLCFTTRPW